MINFYSTDPYYISLMGAAPLFGYSGTGGLQNPKLYPPYTAPDGQLLLPGQPLAWPNLSQGLAGGALPGLDPLQGQLSAALSGLYQNSRSLAGATNSLVLTQTDSDLNARTQTTGNGGVVTASVNPGATVQSLQVTVTALAQAQVNSGTVLNAADASGVTAGTNTIAVTVHGQTSNVSFNVNAGDSNQTVLNSLAASINDAGLGLQATVVNDTTAGTVRLQVAAKATGTQQSFTLADATGNAVAQTGVNAVSTVAADASYMVSGVNYTAQGNTVYLDNGNLTLNLWQASANPVTVTVSPDTQAITTAANNLVNQYNSLRQFLNANGPYISSTFQNQASQAVTQVPGLAGIGVTTNPDGTLSLDQDKLSAAIQSNFANVSSTLGGSNGLATNLGNTANNVLSSPLAGFAAPVPYMLATTPFQSYLGVQNQGLLLGQGLFLNSAW